MPATDVDFEREFEELVRDLRALPTAAPGSVRERVRALGEPARSRTLHDLLLVFSWRRSLLVLAPVCVLGLVAAAVIHGVVHSGGGSKQTAVARQKVDTQVQHGAVDSGGTTTTPVFGAVTGTPLAPVLPTPAPGRYQDYQASLTVRVKDVDALHDRTAQATQLARSFGGYVASVDESTDGGNGRADEEERHEPDRARRARRRLVPGGCRGRGAVRADRPQPADRPGPGLDPGCAGLPPQGGAPAAFGCVVSARAARPLNRTRDRARRYRAHLHPLRPRVLVPVPALPSRLPGTWAAGVHRRRVRVL